MIDRQKVFDEPLRNNLIMYDSIRENATAQGDDCTADYLLDYNYFKKHYKMIAINLSKIQALDADLKAMQQINVTGKPEWQATVFFIIEEAKETVLDFSQRTVRVF